MEENWEFQILVKGELGSLWSWHGIEVEETVWECCQELPSFNRRSWKNLEFLLGSPAAHPLWGSNKPLASHSLPSSVQWGQRRKGQEPCVHCGICPPPLGGEELPLRASHACPRPSHHCYVIITICLLTGLSLLNPKLPEGWWLPVVYLVHGHWSLNIHSVNVWDPEQVTLSESSFSNVKLEGDLKRVTLQVSAWLPLCFDLCGERVDFKACPLPQDST